MASNHNCFASIRFEVDFIRKGIVLDKKITPEAGDLCAICQSALDKPCPKEFGCCGGEPREFSCGHVFHIGCFISMMISSRVMICPLCRKDFFLTHIAKPAVQGGKDVVPA